LIGSGSNERWQTSQSTAGSVSATTIAFVFYHQYQVSARYSTSDNFVPSQSVILSGTQFGSNSYNFTLTKSAQTPWLDVGTTWSVNNPISASPTSEQWKAQTGTSGTVSSGISVNPFYYHEYSLTVTASPSGAIGATFNVTYTQFGTTFSTKQQSTTWNSWADAGTTAIVGGAQSTYNGYTFNGYSTTLATMNSAQTVTLLYLASSNSTLISGGF
jgi:hypothetical protein